MISVANLRIRPGIGLAQSTTTSAGPVREGLICQYLAGSKLSKPASRVTRCLTITTEQEGEPHAHRTAGCDRECEVSIPNLTALEPRERSLDPFVSDARGGFIQRADTWGGLLVRRNILVSLTCSIMYPRIFGTHTRPVESCHSVGPPTSISKHQILIGSRWSKRTSSMFLNEWMARNRSRADSERQWRPRATTA